MYSTHFGLTQEQNSKFELINQNLKEERAQRITTEHRQHPNIATRDRHRSNKGSQLLTCLACSNVFINMFQRVQFWGTDMQRKSDDLLVYQIKICLKQHNLITSIFFEAVLISKECFNFLDRLCPKIETFLIALQK